MPNQTLPRTLAFKANERNVFFHILTACNLSCRHCYINPEQHGSTTLPESTIFAWLELFASQEKRTNLIFLGGEPTLHPALPSAIKKARELGYHSITVDTNGFLHHDLLTKITPDDAVLSFSLDGPTSEVNDPLRGEGVFSICTSNIRKAVGMGFEVSVIYTVSALNIAHLAAMPRLLKELGVSHFFIQIIGLRGKSASAPEKASQALQLSREEWLAVVPQVAEAAGRMGLHVIFPKVFLDPDESFECAGKVAENFFIFPNGRVYCCPLCEDYPINTFQIEENALTPRSGLVETNFFSLDIPEGCVMNKLLQPGSIEYTANGKPCHRISCCLLKQEIAPG
jgi:MoaA/NifB/PqqE/SkfB family radical SAM enzyme